MFQELGILSRMWVESSKGWLSNNNQCSLQKKFIYVFFYFFLGSSQKCVRYCIGFEYIYIYIYIYILYSFEEHAPAHEKGCCIPVKRALSCTAKNAWSLCHQHYHMVMLPVKWCMYCDSRWFGGDQVFSFPFSLSLTWPRDVHRLNKNWNASSHFIFISVIVLFFY